MKKLIFQVIGGIVALWIAIFFIPGIEMNTEQVLRVFLITGIIGIGIFAIRLLVEIVVLPIKFIVINGLIFALCFLGLRIITNFFPELIIEPNKYIWLAGIITGINMLISFVRKSSK